jgi:predicted transcriptional regulator
MAIKRSPHGSGLLYQLIMPVGNFTEYTVQLVCGPGDHQEPVITLMREHED